MGCCLGGCLRLIFFWLWRALLAAAIAMLFARVDAYVERRGLGESLAGRLLFFDAMTLEFRQVRFRRDPACPVCGDQPTITDLIDYHEFCGVPAGERVS